MPRRNKLGRFIKSGARKNGTKKKAKAKKAPPATKVVTTKTGRKMHYVKGKLTTEAKYRKAKGLKAKTTKKAAPKRKKSTGVGRGKYPRGKLTAAQKKRKAPALKSKSRKKGLIQPDPYRKKVKGRRAPGWYHVPGYDAYYRNKGRKPKRKRAKGRRNPRRGADGRFLPKGGRKAPKRKSTKSGSSSKKLKRVSTPTGYRYMRGGRFISKASYDRSMAAKKAAPKRKKGKRKNPRRGRRKASLWKGMKRGPSGRFVRNGPMGYWDTTKDVVMRTVKPLAGTAVGFFGSRLAANLASRATFVPVSVQPYTPLIAHLLAGVGVYIAGQKVKGLKEYQGPALAGVGLSIVEMVLNRYAPATVQSYVGAPDPGLGANLDVYEAALSGAVLDDDTAMSVLEAQDMGEYIAEPMGEYFAEPMGEYVEEDLSEYFATDDDDPLSGVEIYEAMAGDGGVEVYEAMAGPGDDEIDFYLQEAGLSDGVEVEALDGGTEVSIFDQGMGDSVISEPEELDVLDVADAATGDLTAAKAARREDYMTHRYMPITGGGIFGAEAIVGQRRGALPGGLAINAATLKAAVGECYARFRSIAEPNRTAQVYEAVKAKLGVTPSTPFRLAFREAYKAVAGPVPLPSMPVARRQRVFNDPVDGAPMMVTGMQPAPRRPTLEEVADVEAGKGGGMFQGTLFG